MRGLQVWSEGRKRRVGAGLKGLLWVARGGKHGKVAAAAAAAAAAAEPRQNFAKCRRPHRRCNTHRRYTNSKLQQSVTVVCSESQSVTQICNLHCMNL